MPLRPLEFFVGLDHRLDLFRDGPPLGGQRLARGLHPPLPVSRNVLIWGFALLREAGREGRRELPYAPLEDLPPGEMLRMALALEGRPGSYSWEERLRMAAFAAAAREQGEPFSLAELAPQIAGKAEPRLEERLREYATLPEELQRLVTQGKLDLRTAALVRDLPEGVTGQAAGARLSFSARRQFLVALQEVAARDRLSGAGLAELCGRLLASGDPVAALRRLRYPALTALEERLEGLREAALGGSGVRLDGPPWFEGRAFRVEFEFESKAVLARRLRALHRLQERADELFDLLR